MTVSATTRPRAPAPRSEDEVRAFVEQLGAALTDAGMARLPARAFAAMLADEDGRMTSAELADVLEVSPASVSGAVRYLSQVLFLHREREPGTRRDVYVVGRTPGTTRSSTCGARTHRSRRRSPRASTRSADLVPRRGRLSVSADFLDFIADEMTAIAERWEEHRKTLPSS